MNSLYRQFGMKMACVQAGAETKDLPEKEGYMEAIMASVPAKQALCKMASDIFDAAGQETFIQRHLFDVASKTASWDKDVHDDLVTAFVAALGKVEESSEKNASLVSKGMMANLVGRGLGSTPEMLKYLAAGGVLTGAGLGGLSWYLNRDANEDDDDLEVMRSRIDNYKRITGEISEQLKRNGKLPVTNDMESIIQG